MATNFEERLARLESKRIESGAPPLRNLPDYSNNGAVSGVEQTVPKRSSRTGGGKIGMIVFGIALVAGLPVAAYFGTTYLAKSSEMVASITQSVGSVSEMVGKDSKIVNDYQMSRILFKYERGEITKEEAVERLGKAGIVIDERGYHHRPEGQ